MKAPPPGIRTTDLTRQEDPSGPSLSDILSALSHALDLTEGQPRGHAVRAALIARRIAEELQLPPQQVSSVFYAGLLKDSGCSTNAARIQKAFGGDELESKRDVKYVDWSRFLHAAFFAMRHSDRGAPAGRRLRKALELARTPPALMDDVTRARCIRGAEIAQQLGFSEEVALAIRCVDEHWDGCGSPDKARRDEIPLLARIVCVSQTFELFHSEIGKEEAYAMLASRNGRWFDPALVGVLRSLREEESLWRELSAFSGENAPLPPPPSNGQEGAANVDQVCDAFSSIVDAKSSFTAEHSSRVTEYTVAIGKSMGIGGERLTTLRRAALLHDIGKLGVSNAILDKPAKLTDGEMTKVKRHPRYSYEILSRIRGFGRIAEIAGAHHERLDGNGYYRGLDAAALDLEMRILAVADVFDALSAERPYRSAMPLERVFEILESQAGSALDAECVEAARRLPKDQGVEEPQSIS